MWWNPIFIARLVFSAYLYRAWGYVKERSQPVRVWAYIPIPHVSLSRMYNQQAHRVQSRSIRQSLTTGSSRVYFIVVPTSSVLSLVDQQRGRAYMPVDTFWWRPVLVGTAQEKSQTGGCERLEKAVRSSDERRRNGHLIIETTTMFRSDNATLERPLSILHTKQPLLYHNTTNDKDKRLHWGVCSNNKKPKREILSSNPKVIII